MYSFRSFFLISFCIYAIRSQKTYFITPNYTGCNSSCTGDFNQPFDSITQIFNLISNYSTMDITLILLPGDTLIHFLMLSEYIPLTKITYYNFTNVSKLNANIGTLSVQVKSLTIKPLLCEDYPSYFGCLNISQSIRIYLKYENFNIKVSNMLNITNIIFDGSESIYYVNSITTPAGISDDIKSCIYSRNLCCQSPLDTGYSQISSKIICYIPNLILNNMYLSSQGLFYSLYSNNDQIPHIYINNFQINNLSLFRSTSFFVYDSTISRVIVNNSNFNNNYFYQGMIAENYSNS